MYRSFEPSAFETFFIYFSFCLKFLYFTYLVENFWISDCFPHFASFALICFSLHNKVMSTGYTLHNRLSPELYLKNKEHFDKGLIDCLEHMTKKYSEEVKKNSVLKARLESKSIALTAANRTIRELKSSLSSCKKEIKESEKLRLDEKKDFEKIINDYLKENKRIEDELDKALKQIEEIRRDIDYYKGIIDKDKNTDATNSNFPTSQIPFKKKPVNSRTKSDRKKGGQKGHTLHRSAVHDVADEVIEVRVKKAPAGAIAHKDADGNTDYYYTQEVSTSFKTHITETRYFIDDTAEELRAMVLYMNTKGAIVLDRLSEMLDVMSKGALKIRPSTIVNWAKEFGKLSKEETEKILEEIKNQPVVHADETSFSVMKKNSWIHVITALSGIWYTATQSRTDKETGPLARLSDYKGITVHDHLKSYYRLECDHAECNAHTDRYLKSGIDNEKSEECRELLELMHYALGRGEELIKEGKTRMPEEEYKAIEKQYLEIILNELEEHRKEHPELYLKQNKKFRPDYIPLFKRMCQYKEEHLRFLRDFNVPYTNNAVERGCRAVKKKKNISGYAESLDNVNDYCALLTIQETARMKNKNPLEEYTKIMEKRYIDKDGRDIRPAI